MTFIYLNGCSFTAAGSDSDTYPPSGLKEEENIVSILSKKLNCEYFNDSFDGASNDHIKRTTINWLLENEDKWKDLLVLVGWTEFTRFELFNSATNEYLDSSSKKGMYSKSQNRKYWKMYMKFFYDLEDRYRIYLDNILYLQLFLESNNIKYVFWDSLWSLFNEESEEFRIKHEQMFNKINLKNWVIGKDYTSWSGYLKKIDPSDKKTRFAIADLHPNAYGHKVWAEKILEKINEVIHT
jgi:hypothetical protein